MTGEKHMADHLQHSTVVQETLQGQ